MWKKSPNEGLEPSTLRLRVWCSTDWASRELSILAIFIICLLQWYWEQWSFRSIKTTTKDHKHWFQTRKHMKRNYGSEGVRTLDLRFTRATPYHLATKPGDHWNNPMTYITSNTSVLSFCVTKHQMFHSTVWNRWLCGATVARLTPDQKVACSNHVGVSKCFFVCFWHLPNR